MSESNYIVRALSSEILRILLCRKLRRESQFIDGGEEGHHRDGIVLPDLKSDPVSSVRCGGDYGDYASESDFFVHVVPR